MGLPDIVLKIVEVIVAPLLLAGVYSLLKLWGSHQALKVTVKGLSEAVSKISGDFDTFKTDIRDSQDAMKAEHTATVIEMKAYAAEMRANAAEMRGTATVIKQLAEGITLVSKLATDTMAGLVNKQEELRVKQAEQGVKVENIESYIRDNRDNRD